MPEAITNQNPFLSLHGKNTSHRMPNPHAFVALPSSLVEKIGLYTHMGIRIDAAILSTFAFYSQRYYEASDMTFRGGGAVPIPEGDFVLSVLKASENLWARWFHLPSDNDQFDRFYRRVQKAVGRIKDQGLVEWKSWTDSDGKRTRGSIWSLANTPLAPFMGSLPIIEGREVTVTHSERAAYGLVGRGGEPLTNVADLVGSAFVNENIGMFTTAEACYSVQNRGLYMDYLGWTNAISMEGADGDRFVSVGATRPEDTGKKDPPAFLYWFILDIDRGHPMDAVEDVREILYQLDDLGADLSRVIVSYTGGKGCHIRIPSGMFDNPVFKSVSEARGVIKQMFSLLVDQEVDAKVFDPRQLIRIIGSKRAESGIYTRAFTGDEFIDKGFQSIVDESKSHQPITLADPRTASPVSELVVALLSANDMTRRAKLPQYDRKNVWKEDFDDGSVARKALEGIEEGTDWHETRKGRVYSGRNYGMFIASCHLIREASGDAEVAWAQLLEVNQKNTPPLSDRELRTCIKSAERRLARDGQQVLHRRY